MSKNGSVSIQDIAENTESYIPLYAAWKQEAIDKSALQVAPTNANSAIVATSTNGADIETTAKWMTADEKQPLAEAAKKALDDAIAAAEAAFNNAGATQDQVDAAKKALDDAKATYEAAKKAGTKTKPASDEKEQVQVMYRVYNPNSGEHFYTASAYERDAVVAAGWNDEGIGWHAVAVTKDDVTADMELKAQAVASVSSDLMAQSL